MIKYCVCVNVGERLSSKKMISRRALLSVVVLAIVACAATGVAGYYWGQFSAQRAARDSVMIEGEVGLSSLIALVEGHIGSMMRTMEVLAMTDEVKSANWNNMQALLTKFNEFQNPTVPSLAWFAFPNGSYYAVGIGLTDKNIADRPYFPKVMAGEAVLGDLVVSKATGKKAMVAVVPVENQEEIIGALGTSIYLDSFSEILVEELALPEDMVFYALNEEGYTALHSDTKYLLEEPDKMRSETLSAAVEEMMSKEEGQVTYEFEGFTKTVLFKKSTLTGWHVALGRRY